MVAKNTEIDRIFDKPTVKEKYVSNKVELQVIKSYQIVKKNSMSRIQS